MANENLGPAERIIQSLIGFNDHIYHGRPGIVIQDQCSPLGISWKPVTHKLENGVKNVYLLTKVGKKKNRTLLGVLGDDKKVRSGNRIVGEYRESGLFQEAAFWMYNQVAEVWKLDNEFAARWASHAYTQDHKDRKVILAAFMLCQSRKGDPVLDGGKLAFYDDDFRDVGEAMILINKGDDYLTAKELLRIYDVLSLPVIADVNRQLGFGKSLRSPFYGRWHVSVEKWLRYREQNTKMLEGLVKKGFQRQVRELCRLTRYKPTSPKFFDILRWKQKQADDGRREVAIGAAVRAAENWEGLSEEQVCHKILETKSDWKRIVGLLPKSIGVTRAVMAAAIEAKSLSDKDLVILAPTLEELGLLQVQEIRERWEAAVKAADDMRAANIALRMKSKENREKLEEGADQALQKAVEEVTRNMRIYVFVDISASMSRAIELAKEYIAKFLQGFPPEKLHTAVFNSSAREVVIKHPSAQGITNAFRGIAAGGGTDYAAGVRVLEKYKPAEDEDALFVFVGDEQAPDFDLSVELSGIKPVAFALVKVGNEHDCCVRNTAVKLGIPCFKLDNQVFDDVYAIPRTLRNLIAATPVGRAPAGRTVAPRMTLVDTILKTDLLKKPAWAA